MPAPFQAIVQPLIPGIVKAIHESLALGIASTFWISIAAAALAAVLVVFLKTSPITGTATAPSTEARTAD